MIILLQIIKIEKEPEFRECFIYCFDCTKELGSIKILKGEKFYSALFMKAYCKNCNRKIWESRQ